MLRPPLVPARLAAAALVALLAGALGGCGGQSDEERGRKAAERIQASLVDVEAIALAQPVDAAVVAEVQRHLTAVNEYQGEISGKLDSVTVNAIQAYQRTVGCPTMEWWAYLWNRLLGRCISDDGILTDATRARLAAAVEAKR